MAADPRCVIGTIVPRTRGHLGNISDSSHTLENHCQHRLVNQIWIPTMYLAMIIDDMQTYCVLLYSNPSKQVLLNR